MTYQRRSLFYIKEMGKKIEKKQQSKLQLLLCDFEINTWRREGLWKNGKNKAQSIGRIAIFQKFLRLGQSSLSSRRRVRIGCGKVKLKPR